MIAGRALDVSGLPTSAAGPRATIWWGVLGLVAIEAMGFALVIASYFYGRMTEETWPPMGTPVPPLAVATAGLVVLVVSVIPMVLAVRAADRHAPRGVVVWLGAATVLTIAAIALRGWELRAVQAPFDRTFYGSAVWLLLGMHGLHLLTSLGENLLLMGVLLRGEAHAEHFTDTQVNGFYWYFVVASWVAIYAVVYFAPRLL
ncbi:MAG TPA: cytochrome c oxidase subunit 3 [Terriglobales bacterium]|nr:cytochrome c oxidase subunit 3 [Terriglobales bacterium]